ncbi:MAG TPA: helix-turn-helix domain-containing protein [Ohtaekwangia sp.]|uniref:helix-turn-helix domain-containing protein n=1 Tax=Ohtaekwangia sp. TaxID=2066019 RepID=UPI002F9407FE
MFRFQTFPPSRALREYLYCYLISDVIDDNDLSIEHEALPMGITTICFSDITASYFNRTVSDQRYSLAPDIALVGQMVQKGESIFCRPFRSVIALFKSTGIFQLSGIPMNIITGRHSTDATAVFSPKEFRECREQMFQHNDPIKIVNVLDNFLWSKFKSRKSDVRNLDKLAEVINQNMGNVNLNWLTDQTNMSIKTLERHFTEKIGLTPKYFARIIRFRNALQLLENKGRQTDVIKVVEACGYTDQAHLIKEFRHFSNRTPKFYYANEDILSPFFLKSMTEK